jgi:hypothetical protein
MRHKADATAKYGQRAKICRAARIAPLRKADIRPLDLDKYLGGVALWGAVPAVYDTTRLPMDRGIHVHARRTVNSEKEMDYTYRAVRILSSRLPRQAIVVSEIDAIYYMVTSVFGIEMKYVICPACDYPHLDRDWFSVHPHRRHLCAGCGRYFKDTETAVGNPIVGIRKACGVVGRHATIPSGRSLNIKQADFPAGIQIWGSNPALLWTSEKPEEEGIHVHAFGKDEAHIELDETYGEVIIDGIKLDPLMVRVMMAQSAMPSLINRVQSAECPSCGQPQFDVGEDAYTPREDHRCPQCSRKYSARGKLRKIVTNPLLAVLAGLAGSAPRKPQNHDMGLLPEMP